MQDARREGAASEEGFVLAGGRSARMGRPKADLLYQGRTFLENAVLTLREAGLSVRIVASKGQVFAFEGADLVFDCFTGAGPLGGIHAALRYSKSELTYLLPCDLPRIRPLLVKTLRRVREGHDFVVPCDGAGQLHPLCGVYSFRCLPIAERFLEKGERRVEEFIRNGGLRGRISTVADLGVPGDWFQNVNTPSDYSALIGHPE